MSPAMILFAILIFNQSHTEKAVYRHKSSSASMEYDCHSSASCRNISPPAKSPKCTFSVKTFQKYIPDTKWEDKLERKYAMQKIPLAEDHIHDHLEPNLQSSPDVSCDCRVKCHDERSLNVQSRLNSPRRRHILKLRVLGVKSTSDLEAEDEHVELKRGTKTLTPANKMRSFNLEEASQPFPYVYTLVVTPPVRKMNKTHTNNKFHTNNIDLLLQARKRTHT
ncbi:hypothetical protein CEXT_639731 [Caerostris extrusa]|uniref:Uncharacterized protein n=1 Tax=Caerostris extrusa TaxID=172846 RepID=A0AAV4M930_CAEEX|nr:hypothetical protein CEXT_639731 [Caerostris extrusa]